MDYKRILAVGDIHGMFDKLSSVHLHGHQHNKPVYNLQQKQVGIKRFDVGVDANDFRPVSLESIVSFFEG